MAALTVGTPSAFPNPPSGVQSLLKEHYTGDKPLLVTYQNHPLLAMVAKMEDFRGKYLPIPILSAVGGGVAQTANNAYTLRGGGAQPAFQLTRVKGYAFGSVENEAIEASEGGDGFVRVLANELDMKFEQLTGRIAAQLYRSGTGAIGQLATGSVAASTTLTLVNPEDIVNFEVGDRISFFDDAAGDVAATDLRDSGDYVTVSAVDRGAGTLTTNAVGGVSGVADLDYIVHWGDKHASDDTLLCISGLAAWIPSSAPSSALFFSVDRSVDPTRLGGIRHNGASTTIAEALLNASAKCFREGGRPDVVFTNPTNYANLVNELGSKVVYDVAKSADGKLGFDSVVVMGASGKMRVIADPDCQKDVAWMLQMDTWKLYTLGKAPRLDTSDGKEYMREVDGADAVYFSLKFYGNLGCRAPGKNCRIALA